MPNSRSRNVGELDGIWVALLDEVLVSVLVAELGSGLTWSAKTSRRLSAVPSGVQVISVMRGLSVPTASALTSVGLTTCFLLTVYTYRVPL